MAFAWFWKRENSLNLWRPRTNLTTGAFTLVVFITVWLSFNVKKRQVSTAKYAKHLKQSSRLTLKPLVVPLSETRGEGGLLSEKSSVMGGEGGVVSFQTWVTSCSLEPLLKQIWYWADVARNCSLVINYAALNHIFGESILLCIAQVICNVKKKHH